MLKKLYARAVYWLIRPALELYKPVEPRLDGEKLVIDAVLKDIRRNGPIRQAFQKVY